MAAAELSAPPAARPGPGERLRFRGRDGPLLAVCGVCGGAGASTLSCLAALAVAAQSPAPVLIADLGGPNAALRELLGVESERSLPDLAWHVQATATRPARPFALAAHGLRVIARAGRLEHPVGEAAVRSLLAHARAAHALTVIDCGTLAGPAEQAALDCATHVCWVLPASAHGVRCARRLHFALGARWPGRETLAARGEHGRRPPLGDLAALAEERPAPLLLWSSAETPGDLARLAERSEPLLRALVGSLRR
jgi:hypothetical protein